MLGESRSPVLIRGGTRLQREVTTIARAAPFAVVHKPDFHAGAAAISLLASEQTAIRARAYPCQIEKIHGNLFMPDHSKRGAACAAVQTAVQPAEIAGTTPSEGAANRLQPFAAKLENNGQWMKQFLHGGGCAAPRPGFSAAK